MFREKGPDDVFGDFKKGDLLLTLTKKADRIETTWGKFLPVLDENLENSLVRFERTVADKRGWVRVKPEIGDLSFEIPVGMTKSTLDKEVVVVVLKDNQNILAGPIRICAVAFDENLLRFEAFKTNDPVQLGNHWLRNDFGEGTPVESVSINGRDGLRVGVVRDGHYIERLYVFSKDHLFVLTAVNQTGPNSITKRFVSSTLFDPNVSPGTRRLPSTASNDQARGLNDSSIPQEDKNDLVQTEDLEKSPLRFIIRPRPAYTAEARRKGIAGWIKVSATLSENGVVTNIGILEGIGYGIDDSVRLSLMRTIFVPIRKKSGFVSVPQKFYYRFNLI